MGRFFSHLCAIVATFHVAVQHGDTGGRENRSTIAAQMYRSGKSRGVAVSRNDVFGDALILHDTNWCA